MDMSFSDVKVHNEIELCVVHDLDVKQKIVRAFLSNHISYYDKWNNPSFFRRLLGDDSQGQCTLCINSMQIEKAKEILDELHLDGDQIEMVLKRIDRTYF